MKTKSSLKSSNGKKDVKLVRRGKNIYVISKTEPRLKRRQGKAKKN